MLFKDITIVDENFDIKEHMYVGVKDAYIKYIGDKMPEEDYGEVYEGADRLLMPSFYNMHSHLPMSLMRGYGENLPLMTWLQGKIFPFEAHLTEDDMYWGMMLGVAEMLRYGIGATSDMYLNEKAACRAAVDGKIKANISRSVSWFDNTDYFDLPFFNDTMNAVKEYQGYDDGRIKVEFALHSEYTTTEKVAKGMAVAAQDNGLSIHVHVSESQGEVDMCRQRHQRRSPVRYLSDCGVFDVPTTAAHCVHVDDEDLEILKEHNVTVASCPKSNLKLASGICPVVSLMEAGVNVAIGTDSVASNNNLNMLEEMRFFNLLQKGRNYDPTVITPKETLYAATRAGAIGQGREDSGLIKEGMRADITVMRTDETYMKPVHDLMNNLIYSASGNDVVLTMVDGRILYRDGLYTALDIERIEYECEKARTRILGSVEEASIPDLETK